MTHRQQVKKRPLPKGKLWRQWGIAKIDVFFGIQVLASSLKMV